ncbi:chromosomal replication initiator protein DnaA, partial [Francisella tularensis subsp. holarctica]|uniref:DnaA N-terminal domain-containing protein n=1 Tax=Francisella tularensis TaxID=263 RepID=UPI002381B2F6
DKCLKKIKKNLSTFEYKTWIKPNHVEQNSNLFTVYCNNEYFKKHIKSNYGNLILSTIQECHGNDLIIEYANKKFSGEKITEVITAVPQA